MPAQQSGSEHEHEHTDTQTQVDAEQTHASQLWIAEASRSMHQSKSVYASLQSVDAERDNACVM